MLRLRLFITETRLLPRPILMIWSFIGTFHKIVIGEIRKITKYSDIWELGINLTKYAVDGVVKVEVGKVRCDVRAWR